MGEHSLRCDTCAVRHRSVCAALSRPEIERLNAMAHTKTLPPGHIILRDNEKPGYFANIIAGVVKLTKSLGDGRQQIVGLQFASDFLGRPFRDYSPYHAEAVTEVQLCTFEKSQFERLAKDFRDLEHRLFEHTLDELDAAQEWMLLLGRKSAEEKVASFLMMVARRMQAVGCKGGTMSGPMRFELPLARAEIADFLGLTIETVSRQFTRLKVDKYIALEGSRMIIVNDMERLRALSERSDG
jgi:CRP/FNR family transcriptional regulator, anaerobic regulatory protein